ncbi:MAG: hypothetical protein K2M56_02275 [Muribaculaceae bacterium]|nr:hypothetical protein [Bacteroidales bacterium]MDE6234559.1 hypothetical protein [Muribaculaceae bacterium]
MNKNQKIILWSAVGVFAVMVGMMVLLLTRNTQQTDAANEAMARADSLALANDRLQLTNEFNQLNADFSQYEDQQVYLKNDSLVQQYNQARMKVEGLLRDLNAEKASNTKNRARIKQLEAEIASLKKIVRHYLEEIKRLGEENEGLKKEIQEVNQRNEQLTSRADNAERDNAALSQEVAKAKKLSISGLSFAAYNKKGKAEKKINKATSLGASFTINPNATAAAGMKTVYLRVVSPDGTVLGSGPSFSYDGASIQSSGAKQVEYDNGEVHVTIYCQVNTTLTPGDYRVEIFCDGNRLGSRSFNMSK